MTATKVASFIACGSFSGCFWSYFSGKWDRNDWQQYIQFIHNSLIAVTPLGGYTALTMLRNSRSLTRKEKLEMHVAVQTHLYQAQQLRGHAIVVDSWLDRMGLRALRAVVSAPYTERIVSSPDRAFVWLSNVSETIEPVLVWQSILVAVPNETLFW